MRLSYWMILVASVAACGNGGGTTTPMPDMVVTTPPDMLPPPCMDISCATPIMTNGMPLAGTLRDATSADFYSFMGHAGDRIVINANSQTLVMGSTDLNDPTVTDTVVTLYMNDGTTVVGLDDDAWPRFSTDSQLFAQLPTDGTYYVTVMDCNGLAAQNPNIGCAPASGIKDFHYQIAIANMTTAHSDVTGVPTAATTINYMPVPMMTGSYFEPILDGEFAAAGDKHVFTITPPSDLMVDPSARMRANFFVQPQGTTDGDGSAITVQMVAKDASGNILAQQDQQYFTNGDDPNNGAFDFSFPLDDQLGNMLGSTYTVEVTLSPNATITAMKSYYFIVHAAGAYFYGQPELEGPKGMAMNDAVGMAEELTPPSGVVGGYFIDGNLSSASDVDWFKMTIPTTAKMAFFDCSAARNGSGLRGFTAELFSDAGGTMSISKLGPEAANPTKDLSSGATGLTVTGGATLTMKVSATGQDPMIKGSYYQCSVFAQ